MAISVPCRIPTTRLKAVILGFCLFALVLTALPVRADIVKPALVEISVNTNGTYRVEVRASIEAMLTGINARYKNTRDAPTAAAYDELRGLQAGDLMTALEPFKTVFTGEVALVFDGQPAPLTITRVEIPEPGIEDFFITDLTGRILLRRQIDVDGLVSVDLGSFNRGIYIITLSHETKQYRTRFIVR